MLQYVADVAIGILDYGTEMFVSRSVEGKNKKS